MSASLIPRQENDRNPAAERQRPQEADQIESRAKHCRQYLHSACSRPIVRLSMAGLRGRGPSCVFRPLLHIQKRSLRSTGVLCPALLSAKSGGILRRREWPLCYKKRDAFTASLFVCTFYAFFARSQRAVNATASLIAISLSILRLISMPLTFRPCMKVE